MGEAKGGGGVLREIELHWECIALKTRDLDNLATVSFGFPRPKTQVFPLNFFTLKSLWK